MNPNKKWFILVSSILIVSFFCNGKLSMADDLWDEDDAGEAEVFEEEEWEEGDSFETEQYSVELIQGGVRIFSYQMETVPETILIPAEISYNNQIYPVLEIGEEAFAGIHGVKEIQIAEGIRQIGDYAFSGCEQLARLTIPQSITSIGKGAFSECYELHTIEINKENQHISIAGNCLYQDKKTLIWCSMEAEEVVLGEETQIIAEAAFSGCQLLTELSIPATVTLIEEQAFEACTSLDTIHFQEQSSFRLESNSFSDLTNCIIYVENEEMKSMVEASGAYEGEEISVVVKKEYALNYECNGGSFSGEAKSSYSNLAEILLPEADREGYLFLGWSETLEDKGEYIISYEAGTQGDKSLYAMWEPDTDAEDTSLLSDEEEQILLQKDGGRKETNKNGVRRNLTTIRKQKSNKKTEKSREAITLPKDTITEAADKEQKESVVFDAMQELQDGQVDEGKQTRKMVEIQPESKTEPQERKLSIWVVLLFIGGLLCTTGSLGALLYFHIKEKREN